MELSEEEIRQKFRNILNQDIWSNLSTVKEFEQIYRGDEIWQLYMNLRTIKDELFDIWETYGHEA